MKTGAIADWAALQHLKIVATSHPKPGEDVTVYLTGEYNDKNAGFGWDNWALAAAAAFYDFEGNLLGMNVGFVNSAAFLGSTILLLRDYTLFSSQMTLTLGKMPSYPVSIVVRVFASHDNNTEWKWERDWEGMGEWDKIDETVGYIEPVITGNGGGNGGGGGTTGDFLSENVRIVDFTREAKPGDEVKIYVAGKVNDVKAGFGWDNWQIAVAAASVGSDGKPDMSLRAIGYVKSRDFLGSTILDIRDTLGLGSQQMTLRLSPMPDKDMNFQVRVYANHSDSPAFTWDAWETPVNGWQKINILRGTVKVVKKPNWLLIGGLVASGAAVVTVVVLAKEKG